MDIKTIKTNFTYYPHREGQHEKYQELRNYAHGMALLINDLCPESREKSLAFTNLEQALFWANASIARDHS